MDHRLQGKDFELDPKVLSIGVRLGRDTELFSRKVIWKSVRTPGPQEMHSSCCKEGISVIMGHGTW